MKVLDRIVDRPLPVFLATALIVLVGVWCLSVIPVKRTPDVEIPYALVTAAYLGASPEEIESEVTIAGGGALASVSLRRPLRSRTVLAAADDGLFLDPAPMSDGTLLA